MDFYQVRKEVACKSINIPAPRIPKHFPQDTRIFYIPDCTITGKFFVKAKTTNQATVTAEANNNTVDDTGGGSILVTATLTHPADVKVTVNYICNYKMGVNIQSKEGHITIPVGSTSGTDRIVAPLTSPGGSANRLSVITCLANGGSPESTDLYDYIYGETSTLVPGPLKPETGGKVPLEP